MPKINKMDNDSAYWAVLSKSGSGGDTGGIQKGHFTREGSSLDFNEKLKIPETGSSENRLFVQTSLGSYRIKTEDDGDTIKIRGSVANGVAAEIQSIQGSSGKTYTLEISASGEPSLS